MAKLIVKYPENANELLKLNTSMSIEGNQVMVVMSDNSRFAIFGFYLNISMIEEFQTIKIEVSTSPIIDNWNLLFSWDAANDIDLPLNILDVGGDAFACYKVRITYSSTIEDGQFPGFGIDYSEATMFTDSCQIDTYILNYHRIIQTDNNKFVWFPLKNSPAKIYRVYYENTGFQDLEFYDERSRELDQTIPLGKYSYDPIMETVIINAELFAAQNFWATDLEQEVLILCDYVINGGAKADIPIEAIDFGPMFDVDVATIVRIHPDDYEKLPQDPDLTWQVVNNLELQGGYQYWDSEYLDLTAYNFDNGAGFSEGYRGSGTNFQKIGTTPDSFDKNVGDYRQFWVGPDGQFVSQLWKTKSKGYVTFIGPPNKMIPTGIRVYAPSQVKYHQGDTDQNADYISPRIPNGGMMPASLVIKLNASTATEFPAAASFYRKTAAFKPKLLIYLRERVKYNGATSWKDYGDNFGADSEIIEEPYWL